MPPRDKLGKVAETGMPPWFHAGTSVRAWVHAEFAEAERPEAMGLALQRMVRAKREGQHNQAATWMEVVVALAPEDDE